MLFLNKRLNSIAYRGNGVKVGKERTKRTILLALVSARRTVPVVLTLKDNEYFIVGDSPRESKDSRYIGPIKKSRSLGR
ncbi:S26 family signal peptidase [Bacillus sp. SLBN-46]|uniref:S26 family signal peptidase n=1 Tax=Bacillus sp. SLBN-46 TaxID=3042283 RepID=UPI0037BEFAF9